MSWSILIQFIPFTSLIIIPMDLLMRFTYWICLDLVNFQTWNAFNFWLFCAFITFPVNDLWPFRNDNIKLMISMEGKLKLSYAFLILILVIILFYLIFWFFFSSVEIKLYFISIYSRYNFVLLNCLVF